jgi:predicted nucleic acid-binding protein
LRHRGSGPASLLAAFDRYARLLPPPVAEPLLRCTDPDDQVFLDLSRAHHARWLVTRDRALLTLARRAAQVGLAIVAPRLWRPAHGA